MSFSIVTDAIAGVLKPISDIIEKVIPDKTAQAEAQAKLEFLVASGQIQMELAQLTAVTSAQSDINKVEASNESIFVSGWRPAIGWVCASALAYQYLISPLVAGVARLVGHPVDALPSLDGQLWELMFGLLGMGTLRTVEKLKGK